MAEAAAFELDTAAQRRPPFGKNLKDTAQSILGVDAALVCELEALTGGKLVAKVAVTLPDVAVHMSLHPKAVVEYTLFVSVTSAGAERLIKQQR